MLEEEYKHDYNFIPEFMTRAKLRSLHHEHSFAMNESRDYLNEFKNLDYEDFMGISRVRFMLKRNVFKFRGKEKRNVIERVGVRLKDLPCQDSQVKQRTQSIRELWALLNCAGVYYDSSGTKRDENRIEFYKILKQFKSEN